MALLEQDNLCCICDERSVHRRYGGVPAYYCAKCFDQHKAAILGDETWVRFLMNGERQRRKRRNRLLTAGYTLSLSPIPLSGRFQLTQ